ncbi:pyridoxamine kinase [Enterocloster lavalensis]|nr:pyridoxamine kinase [Enterocloster lavalensis]PST33766.1 pyridoxamine kinase [Enterocloster lavalensis]
MEHPVLLINDMAGYGKVALAAMIPVMSHMGLNVCNLPTALVSNTLDYGKFEILDTTGYMEHTLKVWEELGFRFDAVSTGFIVSDVQAQLVTDYCLRQAGRGVLIFCDPIMGDDGKLYNGMSVETVKNMRKLVSCADYAVPNYTEAALLAGEPYLESPEEGDIRRLIGKLREIGAKSVAVTSVRLQGVDQVYCYDAALDQYFGLPFDCLPVRFPGTGDIFSAVMLGQILKGKDMEESVRKAMNVVRRMIELNLGNEDKYKGILVEACLEVMDS